MVIPYRAVDVAKQVPIVEANRSVKDTALVLLNQGVDIVVVVKDGRVIGTVSPRDILWGLLYGNVNPESKVEAIVNTNFIQVSSEEPLENILDILKKSDFNEILVFEDDKPVGVIMLTEFLDVVEDIIELIEARSIRSYGKKML